MMRNHKPEEIVGKLRETKIVPAPGNMASLAIDEQ